MLIVVQMGWYLCVRVRGTYEPRIGQANKSDGYFVDEFVEANLNNPALPGGVYWAGTSAHLTSDRFKSKYDLIPFGFVSKV